MKATIVLDEKSRNELDELAAIEKASKSELIREAISDLYLKEKRAKENLLFFVDLYRKGIITEDTIFLLLPRKDAEAVIIGTKLGKEAASIAKHSSG